MSIVTSIRNTGLLEYSIERLQTIRLKNKARYNYRNIYMSMSGIHVVGGGQLELVLYEDVIGSK